MANDRASLQTLLKTISGYDDDHVHFQPPEDIVMQYPCIVYERDNTSVKHADDVVYNFRQRYQVTVIDRNPDSQLIDKMNVQPLCAFSRRFSTSGLNHDVFVLYH